MTELLTGNAMQMTTPLAWVIVTFFWEAAAVGAVSWLALRLTASLAAKSRYTLALGLLGSLVVLPAVTIARFNAVPHRDQQSAVSTAHVVQPATAPSLTTAPANALGQSPLSGVETRSVDVRTYAPLVRAVVAWSAMQRRLLAGIAPIAGAIVLLWIVGALLVATRFVLDLLAIRRLRRAIAIPLSPALAARVSKMKYSLGMRNAATIVVSPDVEVPLVLGVLSPLVLVPSRLVSALDERDIEMLVAHELAHVERRDYAVNIGQVILEIVFFFHPVTWWLSGRVREEREHCCDARAVEITGDGDDVRKRYIAALLVAEEARSVAAPRLAPSASRGSLLRRAREVLEHRANGSVGAKAYGTGVIIAGTLGILFVAPQPSLASAKAVLKAADSQIWRGRLPRDGWLRVRNLIGDVIVQPASSNQIEVDALGLRRPATALSFVTTRQEDGVTVCAVRVGVDCDENGNVLHLAPSELYSDSATLVVRVPDGVNLLLASSDGDLTVTGRPDAVHAQTGRGKITVRGAGGSVEAATGGGTVRVANAGGDVVVRSSGGAVSLDNVAGDIEVRASSGDIDAALDAGKRGRRWTFLTGSGSIDLRGRSLERAEIQIDASNGRIDSDFPFVRASRSFHGIGAQSSARSSVISASTSNGDVSIKAMR